MVRLITGCGEMKCTEIAVGARPKAIKHLMAVRRCIAAIPVPRGPVVSTFGMPHNVTGQRTEFLSSPFPQLPPPPPLLPLLVLPPLRAPLPSHVRDLRLLAPALVTSLSSVPASRHLLSRHSSLASPPSGLLVQLPFHFHISNVMFWPK